MADVAAYEERMPGQDASERAMTVVHVDEAAAVLWCAGIGPRARVAVSGPVGGERSNQNLADRHAPEVSQKRDSHRFWKGEEGDTMPPSFESTTDADASNDAKRFKAHPVVSTSASLISQPSLTSTSPKNEPESRNEWAAKMAGGVVDLSSEGFLTPLRFGGIVHILSSPECCTTDLDLHHLSLGPVCSKLLAGAVASNSSLKWLNIERTGLGIAGGVALGEALRCNTTLVRLDMNVNDIAPLGGMAIAAGLQSHPSLTELSLAKCGLGPGGAKALGAALETNTSIRTLDMTQNDVGIEGGVAFGRALALNATLRSLSLRCNRISTGLSTERATAFADALEVNATLTFLDFAQNELGPLGGVAFAKAIERNKSLTTLDLQVRLH